MFSVESEEKWAGNMTMYYLISAILKCVYVYMKCMKCVYAGMCLFKTYIKV